MTVLPAWYVQIVRGVTIALLMPYAMFDPWTVLRAWPLLVVLSFSLVLVAPENEP